MTHPRESDYALMERLKAGDDLAFRELYLQHYTVLCHYAASFLKDNFIAESIVSDVIFKLWEGRERLQIHSSLRVYLIIAVRNRCLNFIRDSRLFAERKVPLCEEIIERTHDVNGNPLGVLLSRELEDQVMQAVEQLPDKTRQVFELSRYGFRSYREISEILDISVYTVKYHISQALAILSERLSDYF